MSFLNTLPPELVVALVASIPFAEVQVALPLAIGGFHLPLWQAGMVAFLGNTLPLLVLFPLFGKGWEMMGRHVPWVHRHIETKIEKLRSAHQKTYDRYGALALFLFRAVPIPGTGMWSATLFARAFLIPVKLAVPAVILGNVVAILLVLAFSYGLFDHALPWVRSLL